VAVSGSGAANRLSGPYVGLQSYGPEDARFFFGRRLDTEVIRANLAARRLTLLYGPSGVGKSSVLRAGVVHDLVDRARSGDEDGGPRFVPVVFSSWQGDSVADLLRAVGDSVRELRGIDPQIGTSGSLGDALGASASAAGSELLIVLDQFEEYFLYQGSLVDRFAEEFPRAVERFDVRAHFLVSIREDALAQLDRFKRRLPRLFESTLRIGHLDRDAGRAAIEGPIEEWNRVLPQGLRFAIEPALVDAVLEGVETGQLEVDERGRGAPAGGHGEPSIEAPYLQLVMARLWEEETSRGSRVLRLETLDRLGGPGTIVREHVDRAVAALPARRQEIAASAFRFLVTSSGAKVAQSATDLAEFTGEEVSELRAVLEHLAGSDQRVLRRLDAGSGDSARYEIYHDVLAGAALGLRRREAERRARRERRRARLSIAAAGIFLLLALFAALVSLWALRQKHHAEAAGKRASAAALLRAAQASPHLDRAILLSLEAFGTRPSAETRAGLVDAVDRSGRLRHLLPGDGAIRRIAFSSDGSRLASLEPKRVVVWNLASGSQVGAFPAAGAEAAAFSHDGRVVAVGVRGGVQRWDVAKRSRLPLLALAPGQRAHPVLAVAYRRGDTALVAATADGAERWDLRQAAPAARETRVPGLDLSSDVVLSPDGRRLAYEDQKGVEVVDPTGAGRPSHLPAAGVADLAFGGGSRFLGALDADGVLRVLDLRTERAFAVKTNSGDRAPLSLALGRDPWEAAVGFADGSADAWRDVRRPRQKVTLRGHAAEVFGVAISPDGESLVTAGADALVAAWAPWREPVGREVLSVPAPDVFSLAVGGRRIAASVPGQILVWPSAQAKSPVAFPSPLGLVAGVRVALSRNGRLLADASGARVEVRSLGGGRGVPRTSAPRPVGGGNGAIRSLAFGPREVLAWVTASGRATVWDGGRNRIVRSFAVGRAADVALSSDSRRLAVAGPTGVSLWDVSTGARVPSPNWRSSVLAVAFGGSSTLAAALGSEFGTSFRSEEVSLWDLARRRVGRSFPTNPDDPTALAFSDDGRTVAVGLEEPAGGRALTLFDAASGAPLGSPYEGFGGAPRLAFGDGYLAATGIFGIAILDDILWSDVGAMRRRLCSIVGRNLSAAEWREFVGSSNPRATCPRRAAGG